jgi:FixJ family two-component response regulator
MAKGEGIVYVIDDDDAVRDSLSLLMGSVGLSVQSFASADEFVEKYRRRGAPECIILDVRMPGMSGLDLLRRLAEQPQSPPVIILTGHGDVPMAVESMRNGAVDFLQKPFRDQELLDRIHESLRQDAARQKARAALDEIEKRIATLTPREHEVLKRVVAGETNKAIAFDLELSERTVEIHRARVMEKTRAGSLPELVEMFLKLEDRGSSN